MGIKKIGENLIYWSLLELRQQRKFLFNKLQFSFASFY